MKRVKFVKGMQKKFFDEVIKKLNCVNLKDILQYGFKISYPALKNYYSERRLMPEDFFEDLCYIAKINKNLLKIQYIDGNFGQIKGGKISKRKA